MLSVYKGTLRGEEIQPPLDTFTIIIMVSTAREGNTFWIQVAFFVLQMDSTMALLDEAINARENKGFLFGSGMRRIYLGGLVRNGKSKYLHVKSGETRELHSLKPNADGAMNSTP